LEVDVQQGNFKIVQLLPQVLILFGERNGFLQVGQKLQKLVKKIEGILGVNMLYVRINISLLIRNSMLENNHVILLRY
jgi:hypothetical protein